MQRTLQTWLLLLPLFTGGCMTQKLWTESALDEWNEPAPNPNLHLFAANRKGDLLVVYDEYSERHCTTNARAYFLKQNQDIHWQHARPHFVRPDISKSLPAVPVLWTQPFSPLPGAYAVTSMTSHEFTLFSSGKETGSYELPVYNDRVGQAERVALTPVAVTMDATIIGGVLGIGYLYAIGGQNVDLTWWGQ